MALQESEYLHSTLYRFDEEARRSVVSSFTNAIGNTSAKCIYNVRTDVSSPFLRAYVFEVLIAGVTDVLLDLSRRNWPQGQ